MVMQVYGAPQLSKSKTIARM
jgi:hypothetical protein